MTSLRRAAIAAFCIHAIAGAAMLVILRNGLETNPDLSARTAFLLNHRPLWTIGWLTWTAAALAILFFYIAMAAAHARDDSHGSILRFAVLLTAAAIAPDLSAQALEIGLLPEIAQHADMDRFLFVHRAAVLLSGYVANGLYSLSALLLAWFTRQSYARWVWMAGITVACSGFALSFAALMNSVSLLFWSNVVLVPSLLLWLSGFALKRDYSNRAQAVGTSASIKRT